LLAKTYSNIWNDIQILKDLGIVDMEESKEIIGYQVSTDGLSLNFPKLQLSKNLLPG
jgi:predicted transcriptional regulator